MFGPREMEGMGGKGRILKKNYSCLAQFLGGKGSKIPPHLTFTPC